MSHPVALPTSPGRGLSGRPDAVLGRVVVAYAVAAASAGLGTVALADGAGEHGDLAAHDPAVTDAVVSHRTAVLTALAHAVTAVGSEVSIGLLTLALVTWLVVRRREVTTAAVVGSAMVVAAGLTLAVKHVVGRTRPPASVMMGAFDSGASFPSGHTVFSTVFFGLVAGLLLRGSWQGSRRWLVVAAWAVLSAAIGASRLYLGYHWLTDVLAGWCLAVGVLAATAAVVGVVERRRQTAPRGGSQPYAGGSQSASEGEWSDARPAR
ncbi:phosphatase PAP2 family protein [Pedococcus bigeumensis]|uniref:Phosphatase PAP2 family protein n=1 Tax=Pedococcus bigeumensis TaxID=433644 RepID=A0A502CTI4_9MICO|nr:phosphatase PAP2 family protein [Pedococcus bigeumensis]TPG16935.1 phosphatase PAP2 family protein [Pedococcus bigeumensis]